jgi:dTMP kinase
LHPAEIAARHAGIFITLEGGEGSGKSTQAKLLAQHLRDTGHEAILTQEPAGTPVGVLVKGVLERQASGGGPPITPQAELFLFAAARADHVRTVITPALESGLIVVCDRFADSTVAYQGYGRGLPLREIAILNRIATQGLTPDLTLLLDVPPDAGIDRANATHDAGDKSRDALGEETLDFHRRVHKGFLAIARAEPERVVAIDALQPQDIVTEAVWAAVEIITAQERS